MKRDAGKDHNARVELNEMMDAVKRDAPGIFQLGHMRAKRTLANGARVTVVITMPTRTSGVTGEGSNG